MREGEEGQRQANKEQDIGQKGATRTGMSRNIKGRRVAKIAGLRSREADTQSSDEKRRYRKGGARHMTGKLATQVS